MWLGICKNAPLIFFHVMNKLVKIVALAPALFLGLGLNSGAQTPDFDVFTPIAKYIRIGDADKLSAWFADNLEVEIISKVNDSSRSQARQIVKSFFSASSPSAFSITHQAGKCNMKYALGILNAGGERFVVTIFVNYNNSSFQIQQLKIERLE